MLQKHHVDPDRMQDIGLTHLELFAPQIRRWFTWRPIEQSIGRLYLHIFVDRRQRSGVLLTRVAPIETARASVPLTRTTSHPPSGPSKVSVLKQTNLCALTKKIV